MTDVFTSKRASLTGTLRTHPQIRGGVRKDGRWLKENICDDGELTQKATCKDFLQVQNEDGREIRRERKFYNFNMMQKTTTEE